MPRMLGLNHIHLHVRDLARSVAFYSRVFTLEVLQRDEERVFLRTPGCRDTVTLHQCRSDADLPGRSGGIAHFGFRLADRSELDAVIANAIAAGGQVVERGEHHPGRPYAYLRDPDGYLIEV